MQICFSQILNSAGGAVKVFCNMSNHLCNYHNVVNVCADAMEGVLFYELDCRARFINLFNNRKFRFPLYVKLKNECVKVLNKFNFRLELPREIFFQNACLKKLKEHINLINPDVVICYEPRSMMALADIGYPLEKIIVMFHMDPAKVFGYLSARQEDVLRKVGCVQVLLDSFKTFLTQRGYTNVVSIGNVVPQYVDVSLEIREKTIIHSGRLDKKHKRQHLLIEAFGKIALKYPEWSVKFYGGEPTPADYEEELRRTIIHNKLEKQVFLMGTTNDMEAELKRASIFAFPSAYEGFGLALTEAMSMGLPSIGFKNCPAVNELIKDGSNGILCEESIDALANALEELIQDKNKRIFYGKQAKEDMKEYSEGKIYAEWDCLLEEVIQINK